MNRVVVAVSALVLCGLLHADAQAAYLNITDSGPDPFINVLGGDFEFGLTVNGTSTSGLGNSLNVNIDEANVVSFSGSWIDHGLTPTATNTVYFIEPGSPPTSLLASDILSYSTSSSGGLGHINGTFQSDVTGDLGPIPAGAVTFDETLGAYGFSQPFLSAFAVSDGVDTPEPATLTMLGLGIVGLLGIARRRRKAAL